MTKIAFDLDRAVVLDSGLQALCGIAAYYRIVADPTFLQRELALSGIEAGLPELVRAGKLIGLKARVVKRRTARELETTHLPAIVRLSDGDFAVLIGRLPNGRFRLVHPITKIERYLLPEELLPVIGPELLLVGRRLGGEGVDPRNFGFRWFLPSLWRYRIPLGHVLVASFFVQILALATPIFFQVVVDKVLAHKAYSTLFVLVAGMLVAGLFDVILQYQRTYALSHTVNRIDVELGQRLMHHLLRLPISYFGARPAGQTVARMREIENIRAFLTSQGLFSIIDLLFAFVFIGVLLAYSVTLTLIVLGAIPFYVLLTVLIRPPLQNRLNEKFDAGAVSQQFLVETVVGIQTVKAAAVEPLILSQWGDRLASYVRTSFKVTMLGAAGQNGIAYVNKIMTAAILLFGAKAVMDGQLTVGEFVAFNMISAQVTQPILRLSQLWQDFQQVQISVERLGDILNAPVESALTGRMTLPPPKGNIELKDVTFGYQRDRPAVLKHVSLKIARGEVIGIVGPSGSGKSTLTKLIQRFYLPQEGQILIDGLDVKHVDPAWLRSNIGVVLQDNLLFNRSIHDNIALAVPTLSRAQVMETARLAGADEFIAKLPDGYDTMIEERGSNLSGGQRQRIAIARALATNPPILIFDEATSALDYESERIIHDNMREIVRNRTVIIIAHRLAAVRPCGRIVSMQDGRITEAGTHDQLLAMPAGLYRRLWSLQNGYSAT